MRQFILIAALTRLVASNPIPEDTEVMAMAMDPPTGIGTGVTIAIAPPGGIPSGCAASWNGENFGIAAVNIAGGGRKDVDNSDSEEAPVPGAFPVSDRASAASAARATPAMSMSATNTVDFAAGLAGMTATPESGEVSGEIQGESAGQLAPAAKFAVNRQAQQQAPPASSNDDTTITVRSTRTHTRTVTVNKQTSAVPKPASLTSSPLATISVVGSSPNQDPKLDTSDFAIGCKQNNSLTMTLKNGVLKDSRQWTGYIASNRQFQFDNPPQAGAQLTAGWSICGDGSLALGPSKTFYQCLSGSFYNLYDKNIAAQCNPVKLQLLKLQTC